MFQLFENDSRAGAEARFVKGAFEPETLGPRPKLGTGASSTKGASGVDRGPVGLVSDRHFGGRDAGREHHRREASTFSRCRARRC